MKNKTNQNWKENKQNKLTKAMHKTRLTQNNKATHTSNAKQKYEGEREKVIESLWALFPSSPWKSLSFEWTLELAVRGKNWNRSSLKETWGIWEDLQEE